MDEGDCHLPRASCVPGCRMLPPLLNVSKQGVLAEAQRGLAPCPASHSSQNAGSMVADPCAEPGHCCSCCFSLGHSLGDGPRPGAPSRVSARVLSDSQPLLHFLLARWGLFWVVRLQVASLELWEVLLEVGTWAPRLALRQSLSSPVSASVLPNPHPYESTCRAGSGHTPSVALPSLDHICRDPVPRRPHHGAGLGPQRVPSRTCLAPLSCTVNASCRGSQAR